jgi:hypothetical protein
VVRDFEASLQWKVNLDCTLAHPCITPICDQRILQLTYAQNVDFAGRCSFIHCPGLPMESVLGIFSRDYAKDLRTSVLFWRCLNLIIVGCGIECGIGRL